MRDDSCDRTSVFAESDGGSRILSTDPYPGAVNYVTIWPAGVAQPTVSTVNDQEALVVANAAIVPAGTNGSINVFVNYPTDVLFDINGYFAQ